VGRAGGKGKKFVKTDAVRYKVPNHQRPTGGTNRGERSEKEQDESEKTDKRKKKREGKKGRKEECKGCAVKSFDQPIQG